MSLSGKRKAVRMADNAIDIGVAVILIVLLLIGGYSIWDNKQIEAGASASQWKAYKPDIPETYSFDVLKETNPDVVGWLEIYGTDIDYPLLYSSNPDKYLTLNAMGEYSLAGSIFLDSQCDPDFGDLQTIVYGHHMENELMFGPLDHFMDPQFFTEHRYGKITYGNEEHGLDIFAFIEADAYDTTIYRRGIKDPIVEQDYVDHLRDIALNNSDITVTGYDKILVMSTCATDVTSGRTIVVAKIIDEIPENTFVHWPNTGTGIDASTKIFGLVWYIWIPIILFPLLLLLLLIIWIIRHFAQRKHARSDGDEPPPSDSGPSNAVSRGESAKNNRSG